MSGLDDTPKYIGAGVGASGITDGLNYARIDRTSGFLCALSPEHSRIHQGKMWLYADSVSRAQNGTLDLLLQTGPGSTLSHVLFEYGSQTVGSFELYESPTVTALGSVAVARNKLRHNSAPTAGMATIYHSPTVSALGTRLDISSWGTKQTGNLSRDAEEWVLSGGTQYLARVTQLDTGTARVVAKIEWYEEELADQLIIVP